MADDEGKLPLRRIEPAIQKFVKLAIPIDLERLRKHQINIEKYQRCRYGTGYTKSTSMLGVLFQQLRANIREMEQLCLRVRKEDAQILGTMINPVKKNASVAVTEFLHLHSKSVEELKKQYNEQNTNQSTPLTRSTITGEQSYDVEDDGDSFQSFSQSFSPLPEIPQDQNAAESWEILEENLIELNSLVTQFADVLHSQQEKIDSIEDHVNTAAVNVEEGTKNLGKAVKYKLAVLPVAGALIGGVVGGPIGLLAGFKVAGIAAALGGGVLGFTGGKLIQKKKEKMIKEYSSSCPELHSQDEKKTD